MLTIGLFPVVKNIKLHDVKNNHRCLTFRKRGSTHNSDDRLFLSFHETDPDATHPVIFRGH